MYEWGMMLGEMGARCCWGGGEVNTYLHSWAPSKLCMEIEHTCHSKLYGRPLGSPVVVNIDKKEHMESGEQYLSCEIHGARPFTSFNLQA